MRTLSKMLLACSALLPAAPGALAQRSGDTVFGAGLAVIAPRESLGPLQSTGPAASGFNAATAGAGVGIEHVKTLSLSVLHMFTDNVGAELTLGVPPKLEVDVHLRSGSRRAAASAREMTPALVGKYLFMAPGDRMRPYLGLGVAYARFSQVRINRSDPVVVGLAGTAASLSSGWAPVIAAGFIYNIDEHWSLNASVSHLRLNTTATLVGSGTTTTGKLTLDPVDYVVRIGYRF